jgi:CheY-like chemotaxis protein
MSKKKKLDELITTNEENALELVTANKEVASKKDEKGKKLAELIIANQGNAHQAELIILNKKLALANKQEKLAKEKAIVAGCNDYISKPINETLLYELTINYFKN